MLGLRARLSPHQELWQFFMKTDGRKSEPHTLPHICLPNISPPTPTPLLQVLSISDNTPVDHLAHKKIRPRPSLPPSLSLSLSLSECTPFHLVGKCKWLVPNGVGSKKKTEVREVLKFNIPSKDSIEMILLTSFNLKEQCDNFIFKEVCAN